MSHEPPDHPMDEPDSLLSQAADGDRNARLRLLTMHRERLKRMVASRLDRRLSARIDASDIVQETLAEAAVGLTEYLDQRPIPYYPWLSQIAQDRLIAAHRKHVQAKRRSVLREDADASVGAEDAARGLAERLGRHACPGLDASRDEVREIVRRAIDGLAPADREVLVMRHLDGLETSEIADHLGISRDAVRTRHVRALGRLRERIDRDILE